MFPLLIEVLEIQFVFKWVFHEGGGFSFILLIWFFQDDTAFEKQSALFALAVSDIVLINM